MTHVQRNNCPYLAHVYHNLCHPSNAQRRVQCGTFGRTFSPAVLSFVEGIFKCAFSWITSFHCFLGGGAIETSVPLPPFLGHSSKNRTYFVQLLFSLQNAL